jgi:two-component system chemotaxis sensor kinase CheA
MQYQMINEKLDKFAILIGGFCPGHIPDIISLLDTLNELSEISKQQGFNTFQEIAMACREFVEYIPLEDIHNIRPLEEGLVLLKSILIYEIRKETFVFDYSDVLELLNNKPENDQTLK